MKIKILVLLIGMLFISSCSKDEDSNPVVANPAYVGTYEGTTSSGKDASVTISNIDGKAFVTKYSITYTYLFGTSTATAIKSQTNSTGLVQLNGASFTILLSADANDKITGTFTSNTNLNGAYSVDTGLTSGGVKIYGNGTFSLAKK